MAQSLVLIDRTELAQIVSEAVRAAATGKAPNPRALTNAQLQAAFTISATTVKRLRRRGLPHYTVGESPRYDLDEVLAWLREHGSERS